MERTVLIISGVYINEHIIINLRHRVFLLDRVSLHRNGHYVCSVCFVVVVFLLLLSLLLFFVCVWGGGGD